MSTASTLADPTINAGQPAHETDSFIHRHIGPSPADIAEMLSQLGCQTLEQFTQQVVPSEILRKQPLNLGHPQSEYQALEQLRTLANKNQVRRSLLGMGYSACVTPAVIQRNILENPGWYTQYTPYQAEISQGRLEALLNFQTLICDLTGLPAANASLLDEATAAAEAMAMCRSNSPDDKNLFLIDAACHPATLAVVATRADSLGINLRIIDLSLLTSDASIPWNHLCGLLVQYPDTQGRIHLDPSIIQKVHDAGGLLIAACDILALTLLTPPGQWPHGGADIAVGSTQRLGMPIGLGGPHAAFLATRQNLVRKMPGRLVGISKDAQGNPAYRLAIQTREQHIRREKATSNICTAQVLPAVVASMYALYHGPQGLQKIAQKIHHLTCCLADRLQTLGWRLPGAPFFDTLKITPPSALAASTLLTKALQAGFNLRSYPDGDIGINLDERSTEHELQTLLSCFEPNPAPLTSKPSATHAWPAPLQRQTSFLTHPTFNLYHCEHELLRYIKRLEARDLSLTTSMIPLGSCTMKLNAAAEMLPITWPQWADIHPAAPASQWQGYLELFKQLESWLGEITGLPAVSLSPNAGSQGEYAGLLAIRAYHQNRQQPHRNICLIPVSAHGTNPASAVIAGMQVVPVACDSQGNIDLQDLLAKAQQHASQLSACMITYPSTHGVFETTVTHACKIIHDHGGLVYMDGANMNAQVGLCRPGDIGADVCHLNLHKTFCIPHGGGGPGMGPICASKALQPFLPSSQMPGTPPTIPPTSSPTTSPTQTIAANTTFPITVSQAPYGSACILVIPWMYITLMGAAGLRRATQVAILNANYMAKRLQSHYPIVYTGPNQRVAHEFILDCRPFETSAGIRVEDIAKRLMDYGFHAPTMSWPVPGTLMIEPTESESKAELDRLCDTLIFIHQEITDIENHRADPHNNPLKHAPHTAHCLTLDPWPHAYSRQQAVYPAPWLLEHKYWPSVRRIDNAYGDRNLICTCPPMQ